MQESGEKTARLLIGEDLDQNFLVNFDTIGLKFECWILFRTVHQCVEFQSNWTRNKCRICILILCFEVARDQGL